MAIERSDSDSILMIMCLASAGGTITPTGIRIMVSYLDQTGLEHTLEKLRNQMYPVGSLYFSTDSTSPATIYGGTWERYGKGRTLVSVDESDTDFTAGKTGGSKTYNAATDTNLSVNIAFDSNALVLFNSRNNNVHEAAAFTCGASMQTGHPIDWNNQSIRRGQKVHGTMSAMQPYVAVYIWRRTA